MVQQMGSTVTASWDQMFSRVWVGVGGHVGLVAGWRRWIRDVRVINELPVVFLFVILHATLAVC